MFLLYDYIYFIHINIFFICSKKNNYTYNVACVHVYLQVRERTYECVCKRIVCMYSEREKERAVNSRRFDNHTNFLVWY